ncbi:hypothetical protein PPL_03597 [Heterostelium album PN500]|uniref:Uncharacterized protein n=1 Tax=Heterostelium pallidum (strain ATCC 26659 / Pp 5 / PN500) TaxID=670386 RepID=D3B584_HETP5|nr:hypothetical protein PPL_03597 [Heterostelium album PN500]EFA83449.1 hypothetical protein PPL_03597 [Heterostelium album PN500]|eukprot:XP_020435566.1 hypothetical protein PPL_03597 [Heterostelium album PN500]
MDIEVLKRSKISNEKALELLSKFNVERKQQNDHKLFITGNGGNDDFFQIISNNLQHFQKYLSKSIYGDTDANEQLSLENAEDGGVEASNQSMMEIEGNDPAGGSGVGGDANGIGGANGNHHHHRKGSDNTPPVPLDELVTTPLKSNNYETDDGDISERNSDYGGGSYNKRKKEKAQKSDSESDSDESDEENSSASTSGASSDTKNKKIKLDNSNSTDSKKSKKESSDSESESESESESSESESESESDKSSKKKTNNNNSNSKSKKSSSSSSSSSESESSSSESD